MTARAGVPERNGIALALAEKPATGTSCSLLTEADASPGVAVLRPYKKTTTPPRRRTGGIVRSVGAGRSMVRPY